MGNMAALEAADVSKVQIDVHAVDGKGELIR